MTKMLASVRSCEEAEIALAAGADIIDLKEPEYGALGKVETTEIKRVVEFIGGKTLTSAVCGDLPMDPNVIRSVVEEVAETGVDFIKVGFFASDNLAECALALEGIAKNHKIIAVLFADHSYPSDPLQAFTKSGFYGVMVDTDDKSKGRLLHHLSPERAVNFVRDCHKLGLMAGLAGSLESPDIPRLLVGNPDFLGFRGALCGDEGRTATLDKDKVNGIRALIPEERPADAGPQVDFQLLAARGYFPDTEKTKLGTDKIFVSDFVLPVNIGAYSFEHGKTQSVRFDVTADVLRVTRNPEDMRHVVSYDLIMDGIRAIVARGHVDLVETLAEEIAALLLENPRIVHVMIKAEKLELGPGGVGVIIEREREKVRSSHFRSAPGLGHVDMRKARGGMQS